MFSAQTLLNKTFESIGDAVVVIERPARKLVAVNPGFESIFGYSRKEAVGRVTEFLYPSHEEFLRAGQGSAGAYTRDAVYRGTFTMRRKDGTLIQTFHTLSPIYDENGKHVAAVVVISDQTDWLDIEQRLAEQDQLLASVVTNLPGGIYQQESRPDGSLSIPYFRGVLADQLGIDSGSENHGSDGFLDRVHPEDLARLRTAFLNASAKLARVDIDLRLRNASDRYMWVRCIAQPRAGDAGTLIWDSVAFDITREKLAERRVRQLASYDQVTGLPNRRHFRMVAHKWVEALDGTKDRLAVAAVNLDRFKFVNASHGIEAGDRLLATVAQRLVDAAGEEAMVARLGADEFVVMSRTLANLDNALPQLQHLAEATAQGYVLDGTEMHLTTSIGVAIAPDDGADADTLLRNANAALHRARAGGGNRIEFYSEAITSTMTARLQMERELRAAIGTNQLTVHYQPQVDARNGHVMGLEALVRWRHPDHGLILPGRFIDIAEDSGLIHRLGSQVLRQVCAQLRQWRDDGIPVVPVAVNLSAKQVDDSLCDQVMAALAEHSLDPGLLELEITESSLLHDTDHAIAVLERLHARGLRFALDDFGTGYSALSYLQRFRFRKLKVDRSFIVRIAEDANQANLTRAIIAMGESLHMTTVAEGVETPEQLEALRGMGCNAVQGWIYSKALEAAEIPALLAEDRLAPVA